MAAHNLLPVPAELSFGAGALVIDPEFRVGLSGVQEPLLERAAVRLVDRLFLETGVPISRGVARCPERAHLLIHVEAAADEVLQAIEDESYELDITAERALLSSPTPYGALRGIETFAQLVRPEPGGFGVPAARIVDRPRFAWRGLLLDASRHWLPPDLIKRNLEAMAAVKLNVLHWHLTDDQGFRIESRRFPRLHELGSDGLFYTQGEVREIVEFARDRGIRVMPEFDMPGHASSWFAGYPELASAPGPYRVARAWGGHEPTMDPTREEIYEFIGDFVAEMTSLFPDPYFHVGGDEVMDVQWKANAEIGAFMAKENLAGSHDLQAYFNRRLHEILRESGREMVGWDPVIHPDLPQGVVVQSVRGQRWVAEAVRRGHRAIAASEYYLDLMQSTASHYVSDPYDGEVTDLPAEQQGLIVGGEASMWTEFATSENIDGRTWPRAAAVAERLWSRREVTDIDDMYRRLAVVSRRLECTGATHHTGPRRMLTRLTSYGPTEWLRNLAAVVEPLTPEARKRLGEYTTATPLNRLVDAAVPDSAALRSFARRVEQFLADPRSRAEYDELAARLQAWRDNHIMLEPVFRASPILAEAVPLSETLAELAGVGLWSLAAVHRGQMISQTDREAQLGVLERARAPIAEVTLAIVPSIQRLVEAVPAER